MGSGAAGLAAARPRGNIVVCRADGYVRISDHMQANPQDIPDWIIAEMPEAQQKDLGLWPHSQN